MAASDYQTLFEMWCTPNSNMTIYRRLVEETLADDTRYEMFVKEAKDHKAQSNLHRAFYLHLKFNNIGIEPKDPNKLLTKTEKLLELEPQNSCIKECVGILLFIESQKNKNQEMLDKAKLILSDAALDGNKNAISYLIAIFSLKIIDGIKLSDNTSNMFPQPILEEEDHFYEVLYEMNKFLTNSESFTSLVDAIIKLNMSYNTTIIRIVISVMTIAMKKTHFIHDVVYGGGVSVNVEMLKSTFTEKFKTEFLDMISNIKRLYAHIKPHMSETRVLPKCRDSFKFYADDSNHFNLKMIRKMKNFIVDSSSLITFIEGYINYDIADNGKF